jgi:hypothetical protein
VSVDSISPLDLAVRFEDGTAYQAPRRMEAALRGDTVARNPFGRQAR